eukprot:6094469-Pleurochrysis_carterae.AAC.1
MGGARDHLRPSATTGRAECCCPRCAHAFAVIYAAPSSAPSRAASRSASQHSAGICATRTRRPARS